MASEFCMKVNYSYTYADIYSLSLPHARTNTVEGTCNMNFTILHLVPCMNWYGMGLPDNWRDNRAIPGRDLSPFR